MEGCAQRNDRPVHFLDMNVGRKREKSREEEKRIDLRGSVDKFSYISSQK